MSFLSDSFRLYETVRHLKPEQISSRIWYRLYRPKPDLRTATAMRALPGPWIAPARRSPSMVGAAEFLFLNRRESLLDVGWAGGEVPKLWRYNQHYFDDLNAEDADERRDWHKALVACWIADNPPPSGTGWEPYPTSLRIVNWVKWCLAGNDPPPEFIQSLAVQARWLSQRLERHLLGNHLFANAKALIFAGTLLGGSEGDAWLEKGAKILRGELAEQILADGGHFELSPMYHALALEDVLDLINILKAGAALPDLLGACRARIPAMQTWLSAMSHADGDIAFFNDAAIGVSPCSSELRAYAERLGFAPNSAPPSTIWLRESGYMRAVKGEALVIADAAHVGPSYLPGHAHADTLSFEFSLGVERIFVNGGTSLYERGTARSRQRSSGAHNCVIVEGANSSDVWSAFRVGRRARPISPDILERDGEIQLRAGHDGFRQLPGSPLHWRSWSLRSNALAIEDEVTNPGLQAEAYFHLHPDVGVETVEANGGFLTLPSGRRLSWRAGGECRIDVSEWHPEFGKTRPANAIIVPLRAGRSSFAIEWY